MKSSKSFFQMSVLEVVRNDGLEYIEGAPMYKLDGVDCLVNQKRVYLNGSLYLMPEYDWLAIVNALGTLYSSRLKMTTMRLFLSIPLSECMQCALNLKSSRDHASIAKSRILTMKTISKVLFLNILMWTVLRRRREERRKKRKTKRDVEKREKSVRRERRRAFSRSCLLLSPLRIVGPLEIAKRVVDALFDNISKVQLLHPDPVKEEEGEDDGMFMTANGLMSVEDHLIGLFDKADVGKVCLNHV